MERHLENESIPPCEKGKWDDNEKKPDDPDWINPENCPQRRVVLLPENRDAWEYYWMAKSDISGILFSLIDVKINRFEAGVLSEKLKIIDNQMAKLEKREMERIERERRIHENKGHRRIRI